MNTIYSNTTNTRQVIIPDNEFQEFFNLVLSVQKKADLEIKNIYTLINNLRKLEQFKFKKKKIDDQKRFDALFAEMVERYKKEIDEYNQEVVKDNQKTQEQFNRDTNNYFRSSWFKQLISIPPMYNDYEWRKPKKYDSFDKDCFFLYGDAIKYKGDYGRTGHIGIYLHGETPENTFRFTNFNDRYQNTLYTLKKIRDTSSDIRLFYNPVDIDVYEEVLKLSSPTPQTDQVT